VLAALVSLALFGCGGGGGGEGLNGSIALTTTVTGSVVTATATYTNPDTTITNLIGVPISFSTDKFGPLATVNTNSSGVVTLAFTPPAFNGQQTFTVIATTGNLSDFSPVTMSGRTLTMAAPPDQGPVTAAEASGGNHSFVLSAPNFVTITDPFDNLISGHPITITASFSSTNASDQLQLGANPGVGPGVTTAAIVNTGASGGAVLPAASLVMIVPNAGVTRIATISWTATDTATGLSGSGTTALTITK
jgi:hypothetical protein